MCCQRFPLGLCQTERADYAPGGRAKPPSGRGSPCPSRRGRAGTWRWDLPWNAGRLQLRPRDTRSISARISRSTRPGRLSSSQALSIGLSISRTRSSSVREFCTSTVCANVLKARSTAAVVRGDSRPSSAARSAGRGRGRRPRRLRPHRLRPRRLLELKSRADLTGSLPGRACGNSNFGSSGLGDSARGRSGFGQLGSERSVPRFLASRDPAGRTPIWRPRLWRAPPLRPRTSTARTAAVAAARGKAGPPRLRRPATPAPVARRRTSGDRAMPALAQSRSSSGAAGSRVASACRRCPSVGPPRRLPLLEHIVRGDARHLRVIEPVDHLLSRRRFGGCGSRLRTLRVPACGRSRWRRRRRPEVVFSDDPTNRREDFLHRRLLQLGRLRHQDIPIAIGTAGDGCESRLAGHLYQIRKYCSRTSERKQRAEVGRGLSSPAPNRGSLTVRRDCARRPKRHAPADSEPSDRRAGCSVRASAG